MRRQMRVSKYVGLGPVGSARSQTMSFRSRTRTRGGTSPPAVHGKKFFSFRFENMRTKGFEVEYGHTEG